MRVPCEWTMKDYIPLLRAQVVQHLQSEGRSQTEIASMLGVSQPRIAQYLKLNQEDVRAKYQDFPDHFQIQLFDAVDQTARKVVGRINEGFKPPEVIPIICQTCRELRMGSALCTLHMTEYKLMNDSVPEGENCDLCLRWKTAPMQAEHSLASLEARMEVLRALEQVKTKLVSLPNFVNLIPQVGAQLCFTANKEVMTGEDLRDVAAFPGRIIRYGSRAKAVSRPEFSASQSTATLLVSLQTQDPAIRSILSIRVPRPDIAKQRLGQLGFGVEQTHEGDTKGFLDQVSLQKGKGDGKHAIMDSGGHGFEPITYLTATSPEVFVSVVRQLLQD